MSLFSLLGAFALILIIGGLFSAGLLAWNNDRIRESEGHDSHRPH
jgi:hypothetical protein